MKILKTRVGTDRGTVDTVDTIQHDGGLWLVPMWLELPSRGVRQPMRIIRLDVLPIQEAGGLPGCDYFLASGCIPKDILECRTPAEQATGFVVIDSPEIFLKLPDRKLN